MTASEVTKLRIDLVSDVVCPWCIVGYRQLEQALASLRGEIEAEVFWHPFELNPRMPPEGQELREHIAQKYGAPRAASDQARARLTAIGQDLGIEFNWFEGMRIYNTFAAHQLLAWAGDQGREAQHRLKLAFFDRYFTKGENIADPERLLDAVATIGLDATGAAEALHTERHAASVREEETRWMERGITGVPALILDQRGLVTGAQGAEAMAEALRRVVKKRVEA